MLLYKCLSLFGSSGFLIYLKLKLHKTREINIPYLKYPIHLRPHTLDEYTFREIFIKREYDISLPKNFTANYIIDAGANIGLTSLFFLNRFPKANLISIEPDHQNFQQMCLNTEKYSNIISLRAALWRSDHPIEIVDQGYGLRGFTVRENKNGIPATSLSSLIERYAIPTIDILKIDIEGSEKEVFETESEKWLPITRCLIIELHDRMKPGCSRSVFSAISRFNFSCTIRGENLVFFNEDLH